jgi:hypothetical protein
LPPRSRFFGTLQVCTRHSCQVMQLGQHVRGEATKRCPRTRASPLLACLGGCLRHPPLQVSKPSC